MNVKKLLAGVALIPATALLFAGCSTTVETPPPSTAPSPTVTESVTPPRVTSVDTISGEWVLDGFKNADGDVTLPEDVTVNLVINEDGSFSGSGGCNNLLGSLTVTDTEFDFGAIGSTMMSCDTLEFEGLYTAALDVVDNATLNESKLYLEGPDVELRYEVAEDTE